MRSASERLTGLRPAPVSLKGMTPDRRRLRADALFRVWVCVRERRVWVRERESVCERERESVCV